MAHFVLVHGGAHGGWCWKRVIPWLRAAGHQVFAPTLTGLGERSHLLSVDVDLAMHVTDIVNVIRWEDLREVVLVGHSYGGMVITGVADRIPERIGHLVFLDAMQPRHGESMADIVPAILGVARRGDARGIVLTLLPEAGGAQPYGIDNAADLDWVGGKLTPHPLACFTQPIMLADAAALARLPRTSIYCPRSVAHWPDEQRSRTLGTERAWPIDSGHDVMVNRPAEVARMLLDLG